MPRSAGQHILLASSLPESSPELMDPSPNLMPSNNMSRIRRHKGNIPSLPQTKHCPLCTAKFTRTTHLNRHLRSHTNERDHRCDRCQSQFTRSDLLTRHKRTCGDPLLANRSRRKSCEACAESKIKCDLEQPCSKCISRDRECIYINDPKLSANKPGHSRIKKSKSPSPAQLTSPNSETDIPEDLALEHSYSASEQASSSEHSSPLSTASSLCSDSLGPDASLPFPFHGLDALTLPCQTDFNKLFPTTMFGSLTGTTQYIPPSNESYPFTSPYAFYNGNGCSPLYDGDSVIAPSLTTDPNPFDSVPLLPSESPVSAVPISTYRGPSDHELQHYTYLFFEKFLPQIPVVHQGTWSLDGKPPLLLRAIQACGAVFAKTPTAQEFICHTLRSSREALISEFSNKPDAATEQTFLILAVALLQTLGLFHQRPDQRTSSNIYHGMVVMMIRRSGLIERNTTWTIPTYSDPASLEDAWKDWATHEMIKRALFLSYLHDCCQSIYFSLTPSFLPGEIRLNLPCDDTLWNAGSAQEWLALLQSPSHPVSPADRLIGESLQCALANLREMRRLPDMTISDRFSLFILIHAILCDMYSSALRPNTAPTRSPFGLWFRDNSRENPFALQSALHGWMQCWMNEPTTAVPGIDARFMFNPLPFYWLAQISLMALQQGLPPLATENYSRDVETTFRLVKRWLWHIRGFLRKGDQQQPAGVLWDELMKIRLETWHTEIEGNADTYGEKEEGLIAFFIGD